MLKKESPPVELSNNPPSIAVIGCGAISKAFHLPALARHAAILKKLILIDTDTDAARMLAREYGISEVATDYRGVIQKVDGAVIAVPHHLHYSIALDCIRSGVHVLCEKPLAESAAHVYEIISEADKSGTIVLVNNKRRLYPSSKKVLELLRQEEIGPPRYLEFYEGEQFDWPSSSGFYFGSRGPAKGVLLDRGAHVLDLVCWWLGGKLRLISYKDDSLGGSEAVAKMSFETGECRGTVHLSWLSKLKNSFSIQGESGSIEAGIYDWRTLTLRSRSGAEKKIRVDTEFRELGDLNRLLIDNFLDVIRKGVPPLISPKDVIDSIALIEECYARRERFVMPWHDTLQRIAT